MSVYFAQASNGRIKIGHAAAPGPRLRALAHDHGELRLLALMPGRYKEEHAMHKLLHRSCIGRTEWFEPTEEVLSAVNRALKAHGLPVRAGVRRSVSLDASIRERLAALQRQLQAEAPSGLVISQHTAMRHALLTGLDTLLKDKRGGR